VVYVPASELSLQDFSRFRRKSLHVCFAAPLCRNIAILTRTSVETGMRMNRQSVKSSVKMLICQDANSIGELKDLTCANHL